MSKSIVEDVTFKFFAAALMCIDDIEDDDISYFQPIEKINKEGIRYFFKKD